MDSYEYYLLYHTDKDSFKSEVNCENDEILISLSKLLKNQKINVEDKTEIFKNLLNSTKNYDEKVNNVLELFTEEFFIEYFKNSDNFNLEAAIIYLAILTSDDEFNCKLCSQIIDYVYENKLVVLKPIVVRNENVEKFILTRIYEKSLSNVQTLCNYFDKMCKFKMINVDDMKVIEKIFNSSDSFRKKQGIYLIQCMIRHKIFSKEMETCLKIFVNAIESLESNQSHLIVPALDMLDENFIRNISSDLWTFLIESIINHPNKIVKSWGLGYFMNCDYKDITKSHLITFLTALNTSGSFLDPKDEKTMNMMQLFVSKHFDVIMEVLTQVDWRISFYFILKFVKKDILARNTFNLNFIENLKAQVESIPVKLKNLKIRSGVQTLYAEILVHIAKYFDIKTLIPIIISVFKITRNHKCLEVIALSIKPEDHETIFSNDLPDDLLLFFLTKLYISMDIKEIKNAMSKVKKSRRIIFEAICSMNQLTEFYDDDINMLLQEAIDAIWLSVFESNTENLLENIEILEIAFDQHIPFDSESVVNFLEIFQKLKPLKETNFNFEIAYWKMLDICIKSNCDKNVLDGNFHKIMLENQGNVQSALHIALCQVTSFEFQKSKQVGGAILAMENIEMLIEKVVNDSEISQVFSFIEKICSKAVDYLGDHEFTAKLIILLRNFFVLSQNQSITSSLELSIYEKIHHILSNLNDQGAELLYFSKDRLSDSQKYLLISTFISQVRKTSKTDISECYMSSMEELIADRIFGVEISTKYEQIEMMIENEIDKQNLDEINFRLTAAKFMKKIFNQKPHTFRRKFEEIMEMGKKKVRYFPNSWIHRAKMHCMQALFFFDIDDKIIESLLHEIVNINNQMSVVYLIEIILAQQRTDVLKILSSDRSSLTSQALKSIFTISVMQFKMIDNFNNAESELEKIYRLILPHTMGQNFGVRTYAMIAIYYTYNHISSLKDFKKTPLVNEVSSMCEAITEIIKHKNALKYFNALKNDFRFTKSMQELWRVEVFYQVVPSITNMPYDEILIIDEGFEMSTYSAADVSENESESYLVNDTIEVCEDKNSKVSNIQQKYLPFKYQIPSEELLTSVNTSKDKSQLIVVASLIDHTANLGGLARTCEIFAVENYVISSLKTIEHNDFKTLSKTAEKWIKISEIKNWELLHYIINMKRNGYSIVGAEQSERSVSLEMVKFCKKTVLILGNEKEGIPANLLSLLDTTVEIPQFGVVRSLNVHVSGALLMWEYAKQHILENK